MKPFDIAIVGGGLVGLTLVRALQPALAAGARLVVIDPAQPPITRAPQSPSFDDRATALSAYTCLVLQRLGLGETLNQYASAIRSIEVSDKGHAGYQVMDATDYPGGTFGQVIANTALGQILWQGAQALPGIEWRFGDEVSAVTPGQTHSTLNLERDASLSARLVILCDGGRSPLTRQLGIQHSLNDYKARAVIATARTDQPHEGRAFERFTDTGPIALLPFGDYSAVIWTVPERLEKRFGALSEPERLSLLNQRFGQRLGRITGLGGLSGYPLQRRTATELVRHRLLVLGNAATTLHPVAGQGFNLAVRGVMRSAALLNQQLLNDADAGAFTPLQKLGASLKADQSVTSGVSDTLVRGFGSTSPWVQVGRTLGLNTLDRHSLLGQSFALASMGLLQGAPLPQASPGQASGGPAL